MNYMCGPAGGAVFTGGHSLSLMRPGAKQKSDTMSVGHHPTPPRKSTKPPTPEERQVRGASAIELLMQNVYCLSLAPYMGRKPEVFAVCAAIARLVPVFQFSRPLPFEALHKGIDVLEDHLRGMG
jgi:hypothetical protein